MIDEKDIIEAFKFLGIESEDERKRILAQGNVFVLVEEVFRLAAEPWRAYIEARSGKSFQLYFPKA
jgi:hypothetical protein